MKFSLAFSALSFLSVSLSNVTGEPIGSSVWSLGKEGVKIFLAETFEEIPNPDEGLYFDGGKTCSFHDAASDGLKYVWAISSCENEEAKLNVFDLNTGQYTASLSLTCPRNEDQKYPTLDYHASRKEMWVHCNGIGSLGAYGDVDAFSVNDLISDDANIAPPATRCEGFLTEEACNSTPWPYERYCNTTFTKSRYGATIFGSCNPISVDDAEIKSEADMHEVGDFITSVSSGNIGYATLPAAGKLLQINLSMKSIKETHEIPGAFGSNPKSLAYSSQNKHVYVAPTYCCSCGSRERDLEDCPDISNSKVRYSGNIFLKTGKDVGKKKKAVCGEICFGSTADDGVSEFYQLQDHTTFVNNITWTKPIDPRTGENLKGHTIIGGPTGGSVFVMDDDSITLLVPSVNPLEASKYVGTYTYNDDDVVTDLAVVPEDGRTPEHVIFTLKGGSLTAIPLIDFPNNARKFDITAGSTNQVEHIPGTTKFYLQHGKKIELYKLKGAELKEKKLDKVRIASDFILHVKNYGLMARMRYVNNVYSEINMNITKLEKKTLKKVKNLVKESSS